MRVQEISVQPELQRIKLTVDMESPDCFLTSHVPHVTQGLFQLIPRLASHTCHNGKGKSFRKECLKTEIPHLFEHLIIELQLMAQQNPDDRLCGETEWNWHRDPFGRFHVTVEYCDMMLAMGSILLAERVLISLDQRDLSIDIEAEVERLRHIYLMGRDFAAITPHKWAAGTPRPWTAPIHHGLPSRPAIRPEMVGLPVTV